MISHLAIIMDGNRRWAKRNSLMPWQGHSKGVETVKMAVEFCLKKGIKYLSLYTFSIENFKRSPQEVTYLFELLIDQATKNLDFLLKNQVKVNFVGDRSLFPEHVLSASENLEEKTSDCKSLDLNILFCYGGQQEIVAGVKAAINLVQNNKLDIASLNEKSFGDLLWSSIAPAPDLIIRTGGMHRLSNFLLYNAAYSELYFIDKLWPDLIDSDLDQALNFFEDCKRNFGA